MNRWCSLHAVTVDDPRGFLGFFAVTLQIWQTCCRLRMVHGRTHQPSTPSTSSAISSFHSPAATCCSAIERTATRCLGRTPHWRSKQKIPSIGLYGFSRGIEVGRGKHHRGNTFKHNTHTRQAGWSAIVQTVACSVQVIQSKTLRAIRARSTENTHTHKSVTPRCCFPNPSAPHRPGSWLGRLCPRTAHWRPFVDWKPHWCGQWQQVDQNPHSCDHLHPLLQ